MKAGKKIHQYHQPGNEVTMVPHPEYLRPDYEGSNKLKNKIARITGGDSGIGRANLAKLLHAMFFLRQAILHT